MIIATDMPEVADCAATQCAFNANAACHAKAITIGTGDEADCDTFFGNAHHTHSSRAAGVGACKMTDCRYNDDFECAADSIRVGPGDGSVNCLTYTH